MFKILVNAWKVKDIRRKLIFVGLLLLIYRLGSHIPLPGVDLTLLYGGSLDTLSTDNIFALIAGGGYGTVFAMGIGPYITASIIMQLLTYAIPPLERLQKEGEEGRKKINQITRYVAVGMAAINAAALTYSYLNTSVGSIFRHDNWLTYIMSTVGMVSGTIFIMWLAEILTERGIGNGSSFIIFANILSSLPAGVNSLRLMLGGDNLWAGIGMVAGILLIFVAVITFVVMVQEGERRIPVQYSKKMAGRAAFGSNSSYIPIKVNIAGVMSIIFAISLLQFPQQINGFVQAEWLGTIVSYLDTTHWVGSILYVILIFMFTFFYTSFAINTTEMAENMKKNGGFIPGIRPGKPTGEYVQRTVDRMSLIGAILYSIIAIAPVILQNVTGINLFGGTTLLIVTGVALEFIKQLESQLLMRHYKGFLD
ncbi:MAG: preprotein translocase subunit SecY [Clostridiales bacterium]|nr:preprotein translocase subunit SecY [Clostridiales bacterium]